MLIEEIERQEVQNLLAQYDWRDPKYLKEATVKSLWLKGKSYGTVCWESLANTYLMKETP